MKSLIIAATFGLADEFRAEVPGHTIPPGAVNPRREILDKSSRRFAVTGSFSFLKEPVSIK
jgi:hypothetical protein